MLKHILLNTIGFFFVYAVVGVILPSALRFNLYSMIVGAITAFIIWTTGDCIRRRNLANEYWGFLAPEIIQKIKDRQK